jgi:hypothetical protein
MPTPEGRPAWGRRIRREWFVAAADGPEVDPGLAALTLVLALAPLIPTLAGDDAREKTAALPWRPCRRCWPSRAARAGGSPCSG